MRCSTLYVGCLAIIIHKSTHKAANIVVANVLMAPCGIQTKLIQHPVAITTTMHNELHFSYHRLIYVFKVLCIVKKYLDIYLPYINIEVFAIRQDKSVGYLAP